MTAALLTDNYELTMLAAALRDGTAHRRASFEVFARRLPFGRRYGVVAGTARFLSALAEFRFDDAALGIAQADASVFGGRNARLIAEALGERGFGAAGRRRPCFSQRFS